MQGLEQGWMVQLHHGSELTQSAMCLKAKFLKGQFTQIMRLDF